MILADPGVLFVANYRARRAPHVSGATRVMFSFEFTASTARNSNGLPQFFSLTAIQPIPS